MLRKTAIIKKTLKRSFTYNITPMPLQFADTSFQLTKNFVTLEPSTSINIGFGATYRFIDSLATVK